MCITETMIKVFYTYVVTALLELPEGLVTLNVFLKALAISWKAEWEEAEVWLRDSSPSWPESV